jgi:hypothetical protein
MIVTIRKGRGRDPLAMNRAARRNPVDRDRAVARLRTITIGTGLAGVVAVGGFGALTAATYDGTPTDDITTAAVRTTTATTSDAATTSSTNASSTETSTSTSTGRSTTTTPTTSDGTAHATTGSS